MTSTHAHAGVPVDKPPGEQPLKLGFLTPNPVPFQLEERVHRTGHQYWEFERTGNRAMLWFGLFFLAIWMFPLIVVVHEWLTSSHPPPIPPKVTLALVFDPLLSGLFIGGYFYFRKRARLLLYEPAKGTVSIHRIRFPNRDQVLAAEPLERCQLCTHPIALNLDGFGDWRGFALVVKVDRIYFAVACCKRLEETNIVRSRLPKWLSILDSGAGRPIETSGDLRLGRRTTPTLEHPSARD